MCYSTSNERYSSISPEKLNKQVEFWLDLVDETEESGLPEMAAKQSESLTKNKVFSKEAFAMFDICLNLIVNAVDNGYYDAATQAEIVFITAKDNVEKDVVFECFLTSRLLGYIRKKDYEQVYTLLNEMGTDELKPQIFSRMKRYVDEYGVDLLNTEE